MLLICAIDLIVVITLVVLANRRGLEHALPPFVFFVTLLPEECRIPLPGLFDLYTHRLALIVLAILFFTGKKKGLAGPLPLKNLILLHAGWLLLSTAVSIAFMTSVKQLIAQVIEYYAVYYIFVKSISDVRTIVKIAFAMTAAICVACICGFPEIHNGWSVLSLFPAELRQTYGNSDGLYAELTDRGIRMRSTFPHPILFGGAISMTIPLALYLLTAVKSRFQKGFLYFSLLMMFWCIYKTTSRGPWLATVLSLGLLIVAGKGKLRKQIVALVILVVLALLARPGVADTIWNTYLATMSTETQMGASFEYRPALFRTVNKSLRDQPLRGVLGFGLGSFRQAGLIIELPSLDIETHRWYTCDSAWILFAYESGYVGFLIIAALLFKPVIMTFRSYRKLPKRDRNFSAVCLSCFVSFFFVMVSVAVYGWGQSGFMLWTMIALTVSYSGLKRQEQLRLRRAPAPAVFAGAPSLV